MPVFHYKGVTQAGTAQKGQLEAPTEKDAVRVLRSQGILVSKIGTQMEIPLTQYFRQRIPMRERIIFTRQLAVMVRAGLPLIQALDALQEQTENQGMRKILAEIAQEVKGGTALSKAFEKYPKIFPPIYSNVVKSGEKSGKMEEVLENLANQLEKDYDLIAKVKGAMIYPIVVVSFLFVVILLVIFFILPQLQSLFEEMSSELPLATRILLGFSNYTRKYFLLIIGIFVIVFFLFRRYIKTPGGKMRWDIFKLHIPLFGPLAKKIYMARFTRILGMLILAGLPVLEALETVKDVITNSLYQQSFQYISEQVENGVPLSQTLKKDRNFPPLVSHLIAIGEQSGKMDYVLSEIASFYDKEVENTTRNLSSLIEPILMIVIGIGVAIIALSVLQPIYGLVEVM